MDYSKEQTMIANQEQFLDFDLLNELDEDLTLDEMTKKELQKALDNLSSAIEMAFKQALEKAREDEGAQEAA